MMTMEYSAIVTGGASGIGAAVCRKLASRGINLVIADVQKEPGQKLADEVHDEYGVKAFYVFVDVTSEEDVKKMVDFAVDKFGRLDFAANCAGICETTWDSEESITPEIFDRTIAINAKGLWLCQKYEAMQMKKQEPRGLDFTPAPKFPVPGQRGSICNVASVAGLHSMGLAAYTPSKFAAVGITKNGARFYGSSHIRCNALCPGWTTTAMLEGLMGEEGKEGSVASQQSDAVSKITMGRMAYAHEQANVISFLLSAESSYINGATIVADGGYWDIRSS